MNPFSNNTRNEKQVADQMRDKGQWRWQVVYASGSIAEQCMHAEFPDIDDRVLTTADSPQTSTTPAGLGERTLNAVEHGQFADQAAHDQAEARRLVEEARNEPVA